MVYQSKDYRNALLSSGKEIIDISPSLFAIKKNIFFPFIGKKEIIEARGVPSNEDLIKFKEASKDYFYGTIAPTVVNFNSKKFIEAGFKRIDNFTILIDLRKGEEELWKNLEKKSIRWGVKTAKKNQLDFVEAKPKEIEEFYKIYLKTSKYGGFESEGKDFIKFIINRNIGKLFLIKKMKRIIAGGMILLDKKNNYSILDLTSSDKIGQKLQAMPFLYWNLVLYSKRKGYNYLDLGGYDLEAKIGEKTYNINKFKDRFGGFLKEQPVYSTNWKYPFLRKLLKKMKILKRIYKKK